MKQAVMTSPGKIEFKNVPVPKIKDTDVLIKTHRIGVCGSDIHVYHGKHPYTSYPIVQGHEVAGEIFAIGDGVDGFKIGDMVTIMPQIVCGECYPCRHGSYHICDSLKILGFQAPGVASEYFAIDASKVLKTNEIADMDLSAMVEPAAVAVHALRRVGSIEGKKIFIFGAGTIGNLIGQTAKAMGADKVMVADISDFRLDMARKCGIDFCINPRKEDIGSALIKNLGEDKADFIFDCAGSIETIDAAISNARKGSDIVVVAVFAEKTAVNLGFIQDRELRLIGTLTYNEADFRDAIDMMEEGKVRPGLLITGHYPFDQYDAAYKYIEAEGDKAMKIIIDIT